MDFGLGLAPSALHATPEMTAAESRSRVGVFDHLAPSVSSFVTADDPWRVFVKGRRAGEEPTHAGVRPATSTVRRWGWYE
jgi:hypothetical protein